MEPDSLQSLVLLTEAVYLALLGCWEQPSWSSGRQGRRKEALAGAGDSEAVGEQTGWSVLGELSKALSADRL